MNVFTQEHYPKGVQNRNQAGAIEKKVFTIVAAARVLRVYGHNTEAAERRFGAVPSLLLPPPIGAAGCETTQRSSFGHASELLPRRSVAFHGVCALLCRR